MTAWEEYLRAAGRLDAVRRQAAEALAQQAAAVSSTRQELVGVRARIALQRSRLADVASRAGIPVPRLAPDPTELVAARAAVPAPAVPATAALALRESRAALDTVDASLTAIDDPRGMLAGWPVGLRNALVYGGFAVVMSVLPVLLFINLSGSTPMRAFLVGAGEICGAAVLPIIGYGLAYLTIGTVFRARPGARVDRTPVLGAALTVLAVILLYGGSLALVTL